MKKIDEIARRLLAGEVPALARAISIIENWADKAEVLMEAVFHKTGHAHRIGITGPPGAGKSTLVAGLTKHMRKSDASVGIIAVDPTSPFSGGALLGDRIRMVDSFTDPGVFIRSMASRGGMGGLARATHDAVDVMDASGRDFVLVETVGVGQEELDIVNIADTTVVVLYPEAGDGVQAMKAGLMEIADIFVINKADRDGADKLADEIRIMLELRSEELFDGYRPPVVMTTAFRGEGIEELAAEMEKHLCFLSEGDWRDKKRREAARLRLRTIVESHLAVDLWENRSALTKLEDHVDAVLARKYTPYGAAKEILSDYFGSVS